MLSLKKIEFSDIPVLKAYFNAYPARQCDRALGSTVMWRDYFSNKYAVHDGTLILSSAFNSSECFSHPIGKNPDSAFKALEEYCDANGIELVFMGVNKAELPALLRRYPESIAEADRDWFDYLYEKDAIMNLTGRKYATPRNHINKFRKYYGDWSFSEIKDEDIRELVEFTRHFTFNAEKDESAKLELEMCIEVLENYEAYGMLGGVLRVDGKVIAYSIGEIIGDTLFSHIEKADISYHGAYQMLTNQFLRMYADNDEVKYVNREEDCGDEGLRRSKLSYNPVELLVKNTVYIKRG